MVLRALLLKKIYLCLKPTFLVANDQSSQSAVNIRLKQTGFDNFFEPFAVLMGAIQIATVYYISRPSPCS